MSVKELMQHFDSKDHQKQTICCTVKELISNNDPGSNCYLRYDIINFLEAVLSAFDTEDKQYNTLDPSQNQPLLNDSGAQYIDPFYGPFGAGANLAGFEPNI
jgi:hypothetical protein